MKEVYFLKLEEIKKELIKWGNEWRADHAQFNKKTGAMKIIPVPARTIANKLKEVLTMVVIGENARELEKAPLSFYDPDEGIYISSSRIIKDLTLAIESTLSKRWRNEILDWLQIESPAVKLTDDPDLIPVGNGIVDLKEKRLIPFNSKYVFTTKIATNYNPDAIEPSFNGWKFSKWMEQLSNGDPQKHLLLWQMIASVTRGKNGLMFMLVDNGQGRTGKGTLQELLGGLVGKDNFRSLKIDQFEKDFLLAQGYGARLLIGDDNPPERYINDSSNLKSIITNDIVLVNPKGLPPFTARFNSVVIQSMNGLPKFKDKTGGLYRRFRMLYFPYQFPADKASKRIKDEYIKNTRLLEWILKKALTIDTSEIVNPQESIELVEETKNANDPVAYFITEYLPELKSQRLPVRFLFAYFLATMEAENNPQKISQRKFTREVRPKMEALGWEYKQRGVAPSVYFSSVDYDLLIKYDIGIGPKPQQFYNEPKERERQQPLFEKM